MATKPLPLQSFTSDDAILIIPPQQQQDKRESTDLRESNSRQQIPALVFFLTGNPGLISYYREYLELLASESLKLSLSDTATSTSQATAGQGPRIKPIYAGFSLGGFEVGDQERTKPTTTADANGSTSTETLQEEIQSFMFPPTYQAEKPLYGLTDQIELCYARLKYLCQRVTDHYSHWDLSNENEGSVDNKQQFSPVKVIIAGHSVGAYIALELVRLHHEEFIQRSIRSDASTRLGEIPSVAGDAGDTVGDFNIVSSILLTPTIIDIAHSRSGRVAGPIVSNIPFFPSLVHFLAGGLTTFFARQNLMWIVHKVTGMRLGSAGLKTTVAFLMSRNGVRQAVYMARDELRDMTANKWGKEVWGSSWVSTSTNEMEARSSKFEGGMEWKPPKLFLLFAKEDHWVANETRDGFIRELQKARKEDGPNNSGDLRDKMKEPVVIIDEESGLVHAWCLEQTRVVADITTKWIAESLQ